MTTVLGIALGVLGLSAVLVLVRLVRGPHLADRVVAADTLLLFVVTATALLIARTGATRFAPVLLLGCLVGFLGTVAVARFLERDANGAEEPDA